MMEHGARTRRRFRVGQQSLGIGFKQLLMDVVTDVRLLAIWRKRGMENRREGGGEREEDEGVGIGLVRR